ncbi:hypothetical protein PRNP1_012030 [Phytophthora ramorum]
MLSSLCRSTRVLRASSSAQSLLKAPATASQLQRRTFLTSPRVTSYVMARAKVLHLAARSFLAYNQLIHLDNAASPLSRHFARSATLRERVFMYLVCLIPPDQPIDLPDFLVGARHAVHAVFSEIYSDKWAHNLVKYQEKRPTLLTEVASDDCVDKWAAKLEAQRQALELPVGTTFTLERLQVQDIRLAEAEYEYSDATEDQKNDTCSMYHMNEAVCMKVRYAVTEQLLATSSGEEAPTRHTLRSTFEWSFYSDVSRAQLVDWKITKATPFKLELADYKFNIKIKMPAAI